MGLKRMPDVRPAASTFQAVYHECSIAIEERYEGNT